MSLMTMVWLIGLRVSGYKNYILKGKDMILERNIL